MNSLKPFHFFTFLIFTAVSFLVIEGDSSWRYAALVFVFIIVPVLDYILGLSKANPEPDETVRLKSALIWAPALYVYVLTHFMILCLALSKAAGLSYWNIIILALSVGLYTGGLGITVAHELCHKKEKIHRKLADILLATVWYGHFAVEHIRGHHLTVATPSDPATARRGESVYRFLPRTLLGSLNHAFELDKKAVVQSLLLSVAFTLGIFYFYGLKGLGLFLIQALVAVLLLELVNYVEHYGLVREQLGNGRYEKVLPAHSWNSSHFFSNSLLFNLQRHSDHHASAQLPYVALKHHETAPQLPTGYPGMILLSLIPPLWFLVMDRRLRVNFNKLPPEPVAKSP